MIAAFLLAGGGVYLIVSRRDRKQGRADAARRRGGARQRADLDAVSRSSTSTRAIVRDAGAERRRWPARRRRGGPSYEGVLAEHRRLCRGARSGRPRGRDAAAARRLSGFGLRRGSRPSSCPRARSCCGPARASRIGEAGEIAPALRRRFERVLTLDEGFADGGDILILPDEILIGLSARTDQARRRGASRAGARARPARADRRDAAGRAPSQDRLRAARRGTRDRDAGRCAAGCSTGSRC